MYIEYNYNSLVPDNSKYAQYLDPQGEGDSTITEAKKLIVNDIFELLTNATPQLSRLCAGFSVEGNTTIGWTGIGDATSDPLVGNDAMTIASNSPTAYAKRVTISTVDDTSSINQGFPMVDTPIIDDTGTVVNIPVGVLSEVYTNTAAIQLRFIVSNPANDRVIQQSKTDYCEFYANGGTIFISAAHTHLIVSSMSEVVVVSETYETVSIKPTLGIADYAAKDPDLQDSSAAQWVYFNSTAFNQLVSHGGTVGYAYPAAVPDISGTGGGLLDDIEPPPMGSTATAKSFKMIVRYQSSIHDNNLRMYNSNLVETKYAAPVIVEYDQTLIGTGGQVLIAYFTGLDGNYGPDGTPYALDVMVPPGSVRLRGAPTSYLIGTPSTITNYTILGGSISESSGLYVLPSVHAGAQAYQTLTYNGKKYVTWPHTFTNSYANIMMEVK